MHGNLPALFVRFVEYFLIETDQTAIGRRLLCRFFWIGIRDFSSARQSCAFGNLYWQFFFNRFSNKEYRVRFLSAMHTIQYRQCVDGGRYFPRSVYENTFRNKAIYGSEFFCRVFIWNLAHCNADQKLCKWRNVVCGNGPDGYRLYYPCRNYGNQMGASLTHYGKPMGRSWRSFIQ